MVFSRRSCVPFVPALLVLSCGSPAVGTAAGDGSRDLQVIRERVLVPYLQGVEPAEVRRVLAALQDDGSWPDIDYGDQSRSAWQAPAHLSRVALLARALRIPDQPLHADAELRAAACRSLDCWLRRDPQNPNWWWNRIGVPRSLLPILLLLDDELSGTQREQGLKILQRSGIGMTGQNLVWVAEITAGRGLLERDPDLVRTAYRRIADEIRVGLGEGIQPDFSFHQHGPCLYSHGYGAGFVVDGARIATIVQGTELAFAPETISCLARLILDGTQWMARGAATDFGAEGREITRKGQSAEHLAAAAQYMLRLPTGREDEFRDLAARAAGDPAAPPLVGNRNFWRSDLMTHQRPAYYASARMHSTRVANTDGPANSEGLLSHHLADGSLVVMRTGQEYEGIFGVLDWQRIPGTTVATQPELGGSPRRMGTTDFVGGVSDGMYGLAACDFERDALRARKSWFFFDEGIVCLGAGITCGSDRPVITTLQQSALRGEVAGGERGTLRTLARGSHVLEAADGLWHDQVAYVLLQPASLRVQNQTRSGSWHDCNQRYPEDREERDLFTAWIDHGPRPNAAGYAYMVLPAVPREQAGRLAALVSCHVLANTPALQAVQVEHPAMVAAAFYASGSVALDGERTLQVDRPCLCLARATRGDISLTLADPAQRSAEIAIEIHARSVPPVRRVVPLPGGGSAGSSVTVTVAVPAR